MINKVKITKPGFTLTETLIVISIFGVVAAASFVMFTGARSQAVLDDAQASVVNALERARSRAATGVRTTGSTGLDHGIYINFGGNNETREIYSFEGDSWAGRVSEQDVILPPDTVIVKQNPTGPDEVEINFNRLSATSSTSTTILLQHIISGITTTVGITEEGIIEK